MFDLRAIEEVVGTDHHQATEDPTASPLPPAAASRSGQPSLAKLTKLPLVLANHALRVLGEVAVQPCW